MVQPAPRPGNAAIATPRVHAAQAPDWFLRQLAAARAARRAHLPHSDIAGASQTYYRIALAACTRLAEHRLTQYRSRCNALRQQAVATAPPPAEETCDENADSPDKMTACND
jgi:hypothetical protein